MSDPLTVACPANQWTKVATAVTNGAINKKLKDPNLYLQTYRDTGGAVPTDREEGVPLFESSSQAIISNAVAIDVYVYAVSKAGSVRVDL